MAAFDITVQSAALPISVSRPATVATLLKYTSVAYRQRAYNAALSQFVYWTTQGAPDTTGAASGYPVANLTNITVLTRTLQ